MNSHELTTNQEIIKPMPMLKQAGFTAIELLIGVGVIVVFIAFVLGVMGPIKNSLNTNTLVGQLTTFQSEIHGVYSGQQDGYTGISAAELIKSKAFPGDLNATTSTLTSSSAGKVTITSDDGAGTTFSIQYDSVPSGVCNKIISKLTSAGGWNEVDVGGSAVWSGTDATPKKSAIDTACSKSNVVMKFISN